MRPDDAHADAHADAPAPLCLGGSFNPPHHGHLICARAAAEAAGFARVRLVVSARPPHKGGDRGVIDSAHRVAMCRAAVAGDDAFLVDDLETRRDGPSFTADTARALRGGTGGTGEAVPWLIGADLLAGLPRWKEADLLLGGSLVRFVVMRRAGFGIDWPSLPPAVRSLRESVVEVPQVAVSATAIRERFAAGLSARYLLPGAVIDYVAAHGLYGFSAGSAAVAAPAAKGA